MIIIIIIIIIILYHYKKKTFVVVLWMKLNTNNIIILETISRNNKPKRLTLYLLCIPNTRRWFSYTSMCRLTDCNEKLWMCNLLLFIDFVTIFILRVGKILQETTHNECASNDKDSNPRDQVQGHRHGIVVS